MDLTTAYRHLEKHIYGYILTRWVKGHQDRYLAYNKLSTQAKMNMRADKLAEEYQANNQGPTRSAALSKSNTEPIPGQCIQLIVNGFAVTQSHAKWIRYQITGYDMREYLQERHDWDDPTWDTIDWHGFEKAIRSRPPTMQRRISKFVNGWWNVGKQRIRINAKDFILCPRCKLCRETTEHVLYCSRLSPETQTFRTTLNDTINSITPA
jgi:hypothetical protein